MANILKSDLFYSLTGGFLVGALALVAFQPTQSNATGSDYAQTAMTEIGAQIEG